MSDQHHQPALRRGASLGNRNRRMSDAFTMNQDTVNRSKRRQTTGGNELQSTLPQPSHEHENEPENAHNALQQRPKEPPPTSASTMTPSKKKSQKEGLPTTTPGKTPKRIALNAASSYYFKGVKSASKHNNTFIAESPAASYLETSFLSSASSSSESDVNNASTLSDTTELTASNFVRMSSTSRSMHFLSSLKSKSQEQVSQESQSQPQSVSATKVSFATSPPRRPPLEPVVQKQGQPKRFSLPLYSSAGKTTVESSQNEGIQEQHQLPLRRFSLPVQSQPPPKTFVLGSPVFDGAPTHPPLTQLSGQSRTSSLNPSSLRKFAMNLRSKRLEREREYSSSLLLQNKHDQLQQLWDDATGSTGGDFHFLEQQQRIRQEDSATTDPLTRAAAEDITVQTTQESQMALSFLNQVMGPSPSSPIVPRTTSIENDRKKQKMDESAESSRISNINRSGVSLAKEVEGEEEEDELEVSKRSLDHLFQDSVHPSGFTSRRSSNESAASSFSNIMKDGESKDASSSRLCTPNEDNSAVSFSGILKYASSEGAKSGRQSSASALAAFSDIDGSNSAEGSGSSATPTSIMKKGTSRPSDASATSSFSDLVGRDSSSGDISRSDQKRGLTGASSNRPSDATTRFSDILHEGSPACSTTGRISDASATANFNGVLGSSNTAMQDQSELRLSSAAVTGKTAASRLSDASATASFSDLLGRDSTSGDVSTSDQKGGLTGDIGNIASDATTRFSDILREGSPARSTTGRISDASATANFSVVLGTINTATQDHSELRLSSAPATGKTAANRPSDASATASFSDLLGRDSTSGDVSTSDRKGGLTGDIGNIASDATTRFSDILRAGSPARSTPGRFSDASATANFSDVLGTINTATQDHSELRFSSAPATGKTAASRPSDTSATATSGDVSTSYQKGGLTGASGNRTSDATTRFSDIIREFSPARSTTGRISDASATANFSDVLGMSNTTTHNHSELRLSSAPATDKTAASRPSDASATASFLDLFGRDSTSGGVSTTDQKGGLTGASGNRTSDATPRFSDIIRGGGSPARSTTGRLSDTSATANFSDVLRMSNTTTHDHSELRLSCAPDTGRVSDILNDSLGALSRITKPRKSLTPGKTLGPPQRVRREEATLEEAICQDETIELLVMNTAERITHSLQKKRDSGDENVAMVVDLPAPAGQSAFDSPASHTRKRSAERKKRQAEAIQDSPARNTRSAEKKRLERNSSSSAREVVKMQLEQNDSPLRNKRVDSPARHTRSAEKRRCSSVEEGRTDRSMMVDLPGSSTPVEESIQELAQDIFSQDSAGKTSSSIRKRKERDSGSTSINLLAGDESPEDRDHSILLSSRKRVHKGRKSVMFGSPEYMQYNKDSPSMSCHTPAPAANLERRKCTPLRPALMNQAQALEDEEITEEYSTTSGGNGRLEPLPSDNAHVSLVDSTESIEILYAQDLEDVSQEKTVALELEMNTFPETTLGTFDAVPPEEHKDNESSQLSISIDSSLLPTRSDCGSPSMHKKNSTIGGGEGATVELEYDMDALLQNTPLTEQKISNESTRVQQRAYKAFEEDTTVELEADMGALLNQTNVCSPPFLLGSQVHRDAANGLDNTGYCTSGKRDGQLSESFSRRRFSVSSRRFSLAPCHRLLISNEGLVDRSVERSREHEEGIDQSVYEAEASDSPEEEEAVDIKKSDILDAAGLSSAAGGQLEDIFLSFCNSICGRGTTVANPFLSSVCEMLEGAIIADLDLEAPFENSTNRDLALILQRAVRDGTVSTPKREIQKLADEVQGDAREELLQWIDAVVDSLRDSFTSQLQQADEVLGEIANELDLVDEPHILLSSMENKAARHARRKSLVRLEISADALEDEIADEVAELERLRGLNTSSRAALESVSSWVAEFSKREALSAALTDAKTAAESSERKYLMVKGLSRFRPSLLTLPELGFHFIGACPASCISVSFRLTDSGEVTCSAIEKPGLFQNHNGSSLKALSSFFKTHIPGICNKASNTILEDANQIGEFLRELEWALCRLEHTASELIAIQRRYKDVKLSNDAGLRSSLLKVHFLSRPESAQLSATFEISRAYPFSRVNVELDGSLDLEGLQKLLVKRAKPGFGYLSRTCDVIAAFCVDRDSDTINSH